MRARTAAVALLAVLLAGCGSSKPKPLTNDELAGKISKQLNRTSTLVCWTKVGKLGGLSHEGYTHVCGISRRLPGLYVRTGVDMKDGWCLVTPRLNAAPDCSF
jgi:hypothetical protein